MVCVYGTLSFLPFADAIVSRWDRLLVFGACLLGAVICFFFAFLLLPVLALKPRKFAVLYVCARAREPGTHCLTLDGPWGRLSFWQASRSFKDQWCICGTYCRLHGSRLRHFTLAPLALRSIFRSGYVIRALGAIG